jgi:integrase
VKGARAAKEAAREHLALETGTNTAAMTVTQLVHRWLDDIGTDGRSPTTLKGYLSIVKQADASTLGKRRLADCGPAELRAYTQAVKKRTSGSTALNHHALLRTAFRYGYRMGWVTSNPFDRLAAPRAARVPRDLPPASVVRAAVQAAMSAKRADARESGRAVWVSMLTVSRRGEVCALRWRDVDIEGAVLRVDGAVVPDGGRLVRNETKTKGSKRWGPIDSTTVAILAEQHDAQAVWADEWGAALTRESYAREPPKRSSRDLESGRIGLHRRYPLDSRRTTVRRSAGTMTAKLPPLSPFATRCGS